MANKKISELPIISGSQLASGDLFPLVDISETGSNPSGANKAITYSQISGLFESKQTFASQAEAEAGTGTSIRSFSPLRIKQAITALAPSGSSSVNITTPRVLYVTVSGHNTSGNGSLQSPFLTAQKAFDVAYSGSGNYVIKCGVGNFGNVTVATEWPSRIGIEGEGYQFSTLGTIYADGAAGTDGSGEGAAGNSGTNGLPVTIISNGSINLGTIYSRGGSGGNADNYDFPQPDNSGLNGQIGGTGGTGGDGGDIYLINCVFTSISTNGGQPGAGGTGQQGASTTDGSQAANGGEGGAGGSGGSRGSIILINCFQSSQIVMEAFGAGGGSGGSGGSLGVDVLNGSLNGSSGSSGPPGSTGTNYSNIEIIKSTIYQINPDDGTNTYAHSSFYVSEGVITFLSGGINNFQLSAARLGIN